MRYGSENIDSQRKYGPQRTNSNMGPQGDSGSKSATQPPNFENKRLQHARTRAIGQALAQKHSNGTASTDTTQHDPLLLQNVSIF